MDCRGSSAKMMGASFWATEYETVATLYLGQIDQR
jgi:hypothetical protein